MAVPAQDELDALLRGLSGEITTMENNMEQYKLRPCPFCDGTDLYFEYGRVACRFCQTTGPKMPNEELAAAFWNKELTWKKQTGDK